MQRRVKSSDAVLLAGLEVSAICCTRKGPGASGGSFFSRSSNVEGQGIICWCDVRSVSGLKFQSDNTSEVLVEARCLSEDPQKIPFTPNQQAEASSKTRAAAAGTTQELSESLFLPIKFSTTTFVQLLLWDASSQSQVPLGMASLSLSQALRFNRRDYSEHKLRLKPVGASGTQSIDVSGGIIQVRFRSLWPSEFQTLGQKLTRASSSQNAVASNEINPGHKGAGEGCSAIDAACYKQPLQCN